MRLTVPRERVTALNAAPVRPDREYVLYWMTAYRRLRSNFALQHACDVARELRRPLLVFEALRCDYPWASARLHSFAQQGMAENERTARRARVRYLAYVEPRPGAGKGLLKALAARAAAVVTDDFPAFFLPAMTRAAAAALDVRLEMVDAAGLLPFRQVGRAFPTAAVFRRYAQRALPHALAHGPMDDPLAQVAGLGLAPLDPHVLARWPGTWPYGEPVALSRMPVDQHVRPLTAPRGGSAAAHERLDAFLVRAAGEYGAGRANADGRTSGLSPYLHFGHIGSHEVVRALAGRCGWSPDMLGAPTGARAGYWGLPPGPEAFLDQLVIWRELGYGFCAHQPDHDRLSALPSWAARSLEAHVQDPRPREYALDQLEQAQTHDEVWNAAQRELVQTGGMRGYLRMLWGKKVIEWSPTPAIAHARLVHLNNRFALDGRDPNSYTGILWCFGAFDRPWGPERPVLGRVRPMSSARSRRKLRLDAYLARYGAATPRDSDVPA